MKNELLFPVFLACAGGRIVREFPCHVRLGPSSKARCHFGCCLVSGHDSNSFFGGLFPVTVRILTLVNYFMWCSLLHFGAIAYLCVRIFLPSLFYRPSELGLFFGGQSLGTFSEKFFRFFRFFLMGPRPFGVLGGLCVGGVGLTGLGVQPSHPRYADARR